MLASCVRRVYPFHIIIQPLTVTAYSLQAHTACLILLLSASQSGLYPSSHLHSEKEDIVLARTCLNTLSLGNTDTIDLGFCDALTPIYDELVAYYEGTSAE